MWDVLTGDFDKCLSPDKCLSASLANTESGSIVTFHDSIKAARNMQYTLPRFLEHFAEKGYRFAALEDNLFEKKSNFTDIPCAV
jgi:peptidoglycan/xylan/chitin deacetylase (PgdA/CDA1 family)